MEQVCNGYCLTRGQWWQNYSEMGTHVHFAGQMHAANVAQKRDDVLPKYRMEVNVHLLTKQAKQLTNT